MDSVPISVKKDSGNQDEQSDNVCKSSIS